MAKSADTTLEEIIDQWKLARWYWIGGIIGSSLLFVGAEWATNLSAILLFILGVLCHAALKHMNRGFSDTALVLGLALAFYFWVPTEEGPMLAKRIWVVVGSVLVPILIAWDLRLDGFRRIQAQAMSAREG
jgi:drug/metabolite transporter superfamily protein YnfA